MKKGYPCEFATQSPPHPGEMTREMTSEMTSEMISEMISEMNSA